VVLLHVAVPGVHPPGPTLLLLSATEQNNWSGLGLARQYCVISRELADFPPAPPPHPRPSRRISVRSTVLVLDGRCTQVHVFIRRFVVAATNILEGSTGKRSADKKPTAPWKKTTIKGESHRILFIFV
jgi:hypothetical protein